MHIYDHYHSLCHSNRDCQRSQPKQDKNLWFLVLNLQIATKASTSALLNAAGDVLSQLFFEEGEAFNWKRTLTFGFLVRLHATFPVTLAEKTYLDTIYDLEGLGNTSLTH